MAGRTLLERLALPEGPEGRDREESDDVVLGSIRANLHRILNSQRGFSPIAPEYGLADLVESTFTATSMGRIEDELRRTIERYEPRLSGVQVRFVATTEVRMGLRFDVTAKATIGGRARPAKFTTTLEAGRELSVRRA